ncbi:hypothetical protein ON010_g17907 [Phytophthora cinnamomi]|nr:hypothetical protein ON010_g17907 [Phytophthora cinnamomi]
MISSPPSTLGNLEDFDISPEDVVDYNEAFPPTNKNEGARRAATSNIVFPTDGLEALPTNRSDPENIIGANVSIEEELQMYDALLSPSSATSDRSPKHHVMESAFKRHISKLANDVDLEAKYAFDQQLQQRRDLDTVALEIKMRRVCAEDLQRHLRVQMQQREDSIAVEKHERRTTDPKASTFFSESEHTRQGTKSRLGSTTVSPPRRSCCRTTSSSCGASATSSMRSRGSRRTTARSCARRSRARGTATAA